MCDRHFLFRGFAPYPLLELFDLGRGEAVGLGNQRDDVHLVLQGSHELDVDRTQPAVGGGGQT